MSFIKNEIICGGPFFFSKFLPLVCLNNCFLTHHICHIFKLGKEIQHCSREHAVFSLHFDQLEGILWCKTEAIKWSWALVILYIFLFWMNDLWTVLIVVSLFSFWYWYSLSRSFEWLLQRNRLNLHWIPKQLDPNGFHWEQTR